MPPLSATRKSARKTAHAESGRTRLDNLAAMREAVEYYRANRAEGRALLVQAGIYTKTGKLTKAYGG